MLSFSLRLIKSLFARFCNYLDTKHSRHQVKVDNRWEDAGFDLNDAENNVRLVYQLEDGTILKKGEHFHDDPKPLIVAEERDLECPSIVFSLTRDDDKSNYGVVKYVANAEFGIPNQVRSFRENVAPYTYVSLLRHVACIVCPSHFPLFLLENFVLLECCCVKIL